MWKRRKVWCRNKLKTYKLTLQVVLERCALCRLVWRLLVLSLVRLIFGIVFIFGNCPYFAGSQKSANRLNHAFRPTVIQTFQLTFCKRIYVCLIQSRGLKDQSDRAWPENAWHGKVKEKQARKIHWKVTGHTNIEHRFQVIDAVRLVGFTAISKISKIRELSGNLKSSLIFTKNQGIVREFGTALGIYHCN